MFPRLYNNQSRSWFVAFVRGSWVRGRPCVFVRGSWFRGSWFLVGGVCSFEVRGMLLDVGSWHFDTCSVLNQSDLFTWLLFFFFLLCILAGWGSHLTDCLAMRTACSAFAPAAYILLLVL